MSAFILEVSARLGLKLSDYGSLYAWSITERADFWRLLWDFCDVRGDPGSPVILDDDRMPGARWFPEARLNFSENLLRRRDDADAIVFWGEDRVRRRLNSWLLGSDLGSDGRSALGIMTPGDVRLHTVREGSCRTECYCR